MHSSARFKLHFGPYRTPNFNYGAKVQCKVRGELRIVGLTSAKIPWPVGKAQRPKSLVVYKGLAKAVMRESALAVAHWWGVAPVTVYKWRRVLRAPHMTEGDLRLRQAYGQEPFFKRAQRLAVAKARDPVRCAKIAEARRGKPRPRHVIEALRRANLDRPLSKEQRRKMSESHKRRGTWPPAAGRPWTAKEDALLKILPTAAIVQRTGRTARAVRCRRSVLGLSARGERGRK